MTYAAMQAQRWGKKHVWLYRVRRGTEIAYMTTWRGGYQTAPDFFDHEPFDFFATDDFFTQDWVHTPGIKHDKIKISSRIKASKNAITLPSAHTFARLFLDPIGIQTTSVQILHGFANDPDQEFKTKFRGRVVNVKPGRLEIRLECEDLYTALRSNGLSRVMQRPCPYDPYDQKTCKVPIENFNVQATATASDGVTVEVTEAALEADGHYTRGYITFNGGRQLISAHTGTTLTLYAPNVALAQEIAANGPAVVEIARGCNGTTAVCNGVFGNIDNNGSFPQMGNSPFDGTSVR